MREEFESWWKEIGRYEQGISLENEQMMKEWACKVWQAAYQSVGLDD